MKEQKDKYSTNPYVRYYGKHAISPVHQNIGDFALHVKRRGRLYCQLGLPPIAFSDKAVMEIGPGGGYNAVVLFVWGALVDLVEPNETALLELPKMFEKYKVPKERYKIYPLLIESINTDKLYDIIIAEGFLLGIDNKKEVVEKIKSLLKPGAVAVVTCTDEIGYYFDVTRRIVAEMLIADKSYNFTERIELLSRAFTSHMSSLQFATRPVEDYIADLMGPAMWSESFFDMMECMTMFGEEFEVLGMSSPNFLTDMAWYKDTFYDVQKNIFEQYGCKRHTFLHYRLDESVGCAATNKKLNQLMHQLRMQGKKLSLGEYQCDYREIVKTLSAIEVIIKNIDELSALATREVIDIIQSGNITAEKVASSEKWLQCFGRSQQYVSMCKKSG